MDQQEKNRQRSFFKQALHKAKNKQDKEKKEGDFKQFIADVKKKIAIALVLGFIALFIIFLLSCFSYVLNILDAIKSSKAKSSAVAYSTQSGSGSISDSTRIIIAEGTDGSYGINSTYNDVDEAKTIIEDNSIVDPSELTDFEVGVIAGFIENGFDVNGYSIEELECLPLFLKAEASTQYLDVRKNSEKFDASGNYKPKKISDLAENEVPGVILVQRTNTNTNTPVTLEYKKKTDFDSMVSNNDKNVINYFTTSEDGNLIIAKWSHTKVTVNGSYPDEVPDEMRVNPSDEYNIITEEIAYKQYVSKYTLPFDFLMQLLIITEDPTFCIELTDIVLGSKIIINIQEEETITNSKDTQTYTVHDKKEKRIDYEVTPNIESEKNYFLDKMEDDEGNRCTTYDKKTSQVIVTTTNTSHSYIFEIIEADTWIGHYIKTYTPQAPEVSNNNESIDEPGEYLEPTVTTLTDAKEIEKDNDAKEFKNEKENYYKSKVTVPTVTVRTGTKGVIVNKNYKKIDISPESKFTTNLPTLEYEEQERTNANGETTHYYNLPSGFSVTTKKTTELPANITFNYKLNSISNTYYLVGNNTNDVLKCNISKLEIKDFNKIDLHSDVETKITKYPSDPNPTTNTHIYAKDSNGNYEKFLVVYDKNENARVMIKSVSAWLFEMMEENENTVGLVDIVKYLLYVYDGTNYGVTELDLASFFEPGQFTNMSSVYGDALEEFIKAWENGPVWQYINGKSSYTSYIRKYITEDKSLYIVYKENNSEGLTWNFSYGINMGSVSSSGGAYDSLFSKHGLNSPSTYKHEGATGEVSKLDAVFGDKIAKIKESVITETQGFGLSNNQIDALTAVKYQYGNINGFKSTWTAANGDLEKFKTTFWVKTASGGKTNPFNTHKYNGREEANWKLFCEGIYTDSSGNPITISKKNSAKNIIDKAEEIHTYIENNKYTYGHTNGGTPEGMRNQRVVNCISYVTWVYCEAGAIDEIYIQCTAFEKAILTGKYKDLFIKIDKYEDLVEGDIMYFGNSQHAEIYAGNGYSYNTGSTEAIQRDEPTPKGRDRQSLSFKCGYRLKSSGVDGLPYYNGLILEQALWLTKAFYSGGWIYPNSSGTYSGIIHPIMDNNGKPTGTGLKEGGTWRVSCNMFLSETLNHAGLVKNGKATVWAINPDTIIARFKNEYNIKLVAIPTDEILPGDILYYYPISEHKHTCIVTEVTDSYIAKTSSTEYRNIGRGDIKTGSNGSQRGYVRLTKDFVRKNWRAFRVSD